MCACLGAERAPLEAQNVKGETVESALTSFNDFLGAVDDLVWGIPLICLILLGGIFLTIRVGGLQFRKLGKALHYMMKNEKGAGGEVTSFAALCTALSATIGTGNIVGVATAVVAGGPGALFWMWIAALFGMATKFSEGMLAVKYRSYDKETGHVLGGPFYYIERGMGKNWKWLAKLFAFFGVCVGLLGIGTFTQVNSISSAIKGFFDPDGVAVAFSLFGNDYAWATVIGGLLLAVLVALIVIGGLRRIAAVAEKVIPIMVVIYVAMGLLVILFNITSLPDAFVQIFEGAFGLRAAAGGALGAMIIAMQKGIARGIFSNEAGLGSAPIAAAAAQTREPVRQGLVSMTGTFLDTIIVCSMTGLALVMTGAGNTGLEGAQVTMFAFAEGLPFVPAAVTNFLVMLCMALFGFTTILGWDYYSERCLEYLTNGNMKAVKVYRWLYIIAVFIGPYMTVAAVWTIADIFNGLMAIPNMIALLALSGVIARETRDFLRRLDANGGHEEGMEPYVNDPATWKSGAPE